MIKDYNLSEEEADRIREPTTFTGIKLRLFIFLLFIIA